MSCIQRKKKTNSLSLPSFLETSVRDMCIHTALISERVELERYSTGSTAPSGQSSILFFSDAFSHFYSCFMIGVTMSQLILAREANNQLEIIRKQAEVAKFEAMDLSRNLRRESENSRSAV